MQAPSRIKTLIISVALGLAIGSVIWWTRTPDPQTIETGTTQGTSSSVAVASESRSPESPSQPAQPTSPPVAASVLSRDERDWIQARMDEATAVLRGIEANHAIPMKKRETEQARTDSVQVPALTVEQLQPVYHTLSRASRDLVPESELSRGFRKRADAFLGSLQARPAKYVRRSWDKHTGLISYSVIQLSETAKVTETEDGVIHVEGKNKVSQKSWDRSEGLDHLFKNEPAAGVNLLPGSNVLGGTQVDEGKP